MREVVWLGDAKKRLKEFPGETQRAMGGALMLAQWGGMAEHAKPFHGVGSGVFEMAERQKCFAHIGKWMKYSNEAT